MRNIKKDGNEKERELKKLYEFAKNEYAKGNKEDKLKKSKKSGK